MKSDQMINQARVIRSIEWIQLPPEVTKLRGVAQASTKALETELAAPIHQATSVQGVVVSFGGLPIRSLVVKALKALSLVGFEGRTIVMPAPSAEVPTYGLDVEFLPPSSRFHSYLAAADLAICAAGLTLYEAAFLGVPTVCLAVLSTSGQHRSHQLDETGPRMQEAGACRFVGLGDSLSPQQLARHIGELLHSAELRGRMSANGMRLLDGKGLIRTADAILSLLPRSPH